MNKIKEFIKQIVTSHSGISSKRVCGVLGFLVITGIIIFCTITNVEAPAILETFIWAVCALLGIDSVTGIWKNYNNG
jgi:hypothetical protein